MTRPAQLTRSPEMEVLSFIASHDLQEPLRKITTFADLLRQRCSWALPADGRLYLENIAGSANRMRRVIDDFLQFANVDAKEPHFADVNLNEVIRRALNDLHEPAERALAEVRFDPLPTLRGDAEQLRRVFFHLFDNAIKFRSAEHSLAIRVYARSLSGRVRIFVEDNGIGIDPRYLHRVFRPFERLHRGYDGEGMGLAICRRIIDRHGGSIRVRSRPADGTTIVIDLPRGGWGHGSRAERRGAASGRGRRRGLSSHRAGAQGGALRGSVQARRRR